MLLSRAQLGEGKYSQSLRSLHLSPPPLIPEDRRILLLRVLPPKPRMVTKTFSFFHPEETELSTMNAEFHRTGKMMTVIPGQILAPRIHLHGSNWGLLTSTQSVMCAVYDVLLDMVQLVGWEKFCKLRSSIFVIPDDEDNSSLENEVNRIAVLIDWTIEETALTPVSLTFNFMDPVAWERPKMKTEATYARSISVPRQISLDLEKSKKELELDSKTQVASNILTKGLAQMTRQSLEISKLRPSASIGIKEDETGSSKSPFESSSEFSMTSRTGEIYTESELLNSPGPEPLDSGPPSISRRVRTEIHTSAHLDPLPSPDEVPDAPEDSLPNQCPPFALSSSQSAPSTASQDQWQVKIVSMGIQDRVKYFEKVAKEKSERQGKLQIMGKLEEDNTVASMMPRRAKYQVSHTILEVLIKETPESELLLKTEDEELIQEAEQESPEPGEKQDSSLEPDWGSFSLQDLSFLPQKVNSGGERSGSGQWVVTPMDSELVGLVQEAVANEKRCEISPWLDELILALWEDLAIFTDFKTLDRTLKSRNMQTHAEQILGTIEYNTDTTEEDEKTPKSLISIPDSRPVDWMRRGLLCQRLRKTADAEQAFRVCSFLSFNLTSLLALSQIYSDWGYCKGAMMILNRIAHFHHKKHDSRKELYLPLSLVKCLSMLLESVGNKDVKSAAEKCHPLLKSVLEDVLKWKVQSGSSE